MLKKTKKSIRRLGAVVMALAMAMSVMAINAFAVDENPDMRAFKKTYTNTAVQPAESRSYKVDTKSVANNSNASYTNANIPDVTVAKAADSDNFQITLPAYEGIGQFTYNMSEVDGDTAGVTYDAADITVVVLRTWKDINAGTAESNINTVVKIQNADGSAKVSEVTNTFETGSLTVKKELAGDFADPNETFTITVTLKAPEGKVVKNDFKVGDTTVAAADWVNGEKTVTLNLKGGESKILSNLPVGVTYTVAETEPKGHTPTINGATGTISTTAAEAVVTNTKNSSPVTGVIMNIAPYVLMVALAGGIAFFFLRRKHAE